jgi:hypothetical protein
MGTSEHQFISRTATPTDESDEQLRTLAFKKFQLLRLSIAAGDEKAAACVAESLRALFADGSALEGMVRVAFSVNYEGLGRTLFSVIQDVMFTDAGIEAARELGAPGQFPASLEARRDAALDAVGEAIKQLGM